MGLISDWEVESICREGYNVALAEARNLDYIHDEWKLVDYADGAFLNTTRSRLDYRVDNSQQITIASWRNRLMADVRSIFKEREEAREAAEAEQRRAVERKRQAEEEAERERQAAISRKRKAAEEAERQRRAEEEAERKRQEAESQAKCMANNNANNKKLAAIEAAWREKRSKQAQPSTTTNNNTAAARTSVCPQCGQPVSNVAKFCTSCGTRLQTTCPSCGTTLKSSTKFCVQCGTKLK